MIYQNFRKKNYEILERLNLTVVESPIANVPSDVVTILCSDLKHI